jgi:hypothetical protein
MLSSLPAEERESVWDEVEQALKKFEVDGSFVGPCEMIVAVAKK